MGAGVKGCPLDDVVSINIPVYLVTLTNSVECGFISLASLALTCAVSVSPFIKVRIVHILSRHLHVPVPNIGMSFTLVRLYRRN